MSASLRYNRILGSRLFGKVTGFYSHFDYQMQNKNIFPLGETMLTNEYKLTNDINDFGLKAALEFIPSNKYTLRVGVESIKHTFYPGKVSFIDSSQESISVENDSRAIPAIESAVYTENDLDVHKYLKVNVGLRLSQFNVEGQTYHGFEPRLSVGIPFHEKHTLRFGFARVNQYIHQLSSNGVGVPNDVWVPATKKVMPVTSQQLDLGWQWEIGGKGQWSTSLEVYRKRMFNLIDYPQGVNILSDFKNNWQDLVTTRGVGLMRGVEGMIQKKEGRLNGWVSYTYSKSERRFDIINDGAWYLSRYDRTHNFATVLNYKINPRWAVASNWMYQTGYPVTLPKAAGLDLSGQPTAIYVQRNNQRMPAYHRLDMAFTYNYLTSKHHREAAWNFGVYNLYNRANPYYLEFKTLYKSTGTPPGNVTSTFDRNEIKKQSVLPILPYVSYQIKF